MQKGGRELEGPRRVDNSSSSSSRSSALQMVRLSSQRRQPINGLLRLLTAELSQREAPEGETDRQTDVLFFSHSKLRSSPDASTKQRRFSPLTSPMSKLLLLRRPQRIAAFLKGNQWLSLGPLIRSSKPPWLVPAARAWFIPIRSDPIRCFQSMCVRIMAWSLEQAGCFCRISECIGREKELSIGEMSRFLKASYPNRGMLV